MKIRKALSLLFIYIFFPTMLIYGQLVCGQPKSVILTIAAASDLSKVLEDVRYKFESLYPYIKLQFTFGASGNLSAQIQNNAPYDLFLSADEWFPYQLQKMHFSEKDGLFLYATGRLAIWMRKDLNLNLERDKISVLLSNKVSTIAIANPQVAPYGKAAELVLHNVGIYDKVKSKLVFADNIAHAAQMLHMGTVDAGIISHSQANSLLLLRNGFVLDIPDNFHLPIKQAGIIMKNSAHGKESRIFRDFLVSQCGQNILKKHGFNKP